MTCKRLLPFSVEALLSKSSEENCVELSDFVANDDTISKEDAKIGPSASLPTELEEGGVRVRLLESQLWEEFHKHGTEMIITKSGR